VAALAEFHIPQAAASSVTGHPHWQLTAALGLADLPLEGTALVGAGALILGGFSVGGTMWFGPAALPAAADPGGPHRGRYPARPAPGHQVGSTTTSAASRGAVSACTQDRGGGGAGHRRRWRRHHHPFPPATGAAMS
jgi:hypothetical protein